MNLLHNFFICTLFSFMFAARIKKSSTGTTTATIWGKRRWKEFSDMSGGLKSSFQSIDTFNYSSHSFSFKQWDDVWWQPQSNCCKIVLRSHSIVGEHKHTTCLCWQFFCLFSPNAFSFQIDTQFKAQRKNKLPTVKCRLHVSTQNVLPFKCQ